MNTLAAAAFAVPFVSCMAWAGQPPAFSDLGYAEAVAANEAAGDRLLIVKFTAEWCAPCKMMDRTTWSDEAVVGYLRQHGVTAIQVDVDEQADIAQANSIRAMPTMVIYRGGAEFDRAVGAMDAAGMTGWLDGARAGRTKAAELQAKAGERVKADGSVDVKERLDLARELAAGADAEAAAAEFVWLWSNMLDHDPSMSGVRVSFMARDMAGLAERSEKARAAFEELRDGLTARLEAEGRASHKDLTDWLVLNIRVLGDDGAVREWVERVRTRPTAGDTFRAMEHVLGDWLLEQGEWALAGMAKGSADSVIARARWMHSEMVENNKQWVERDESVAAMLEDSAQRRLIDTLAEFHAACLAAGREEDAWRAAEALLKDMPTDAARLALCRDAVRAGAVRPRHAELAASVKGVEAEALGGQIQAALNNEG